MNRLITKIPTKAGWCGECSRWRYCDHECESKLICINCLTCLRNQNLVEFIKPKPRKNQIETAKNYRSYRALEIKSEAPDTSESPNVSTNCLNDRTLKARILGFLITNKSAFCVRDIAIRFKSKHSVIWRILEEYVMSGDVVATKKKRNRIYAHSFHIKEVDIQGYESLHRSRMINQVREILESNQDEWYSSRRMTDELTDVLNKIPRQQSVLNCLRFLVVEGKAIGYFDHRYDSNLFGSIAGKSKLLEKTPENQILSFLKEGRKTRQEIALHLGRTKRSIKGVQKILWSLRNQERVELFTVGKTQYVKLI